MPNNQSDTVYPLRLQDLCELSLTQIGAVCHYIWYNCLSGTPLLSLSHCAIITLASVPGGVRKRIAGVSVQLFLNIPEEHAAADAFQI